MGNNGYGIIPQEIKGINKNRRENMRIKKAIRYIRNNKITIIHQENKTEANAIDTIIRALRNGYTLCKVDECTTKISNIQPSSSRLLNSHDYDVVLNECIKIIKEGCE